MSRHLLIDCDVLVYASAFGAQKTRYTVHHEGDSRTFENAKDRDAWLADNGLTKSDVVIDSFIDVLAESAAIKIAMNNLDHILTECKSDQYTLFLTGKGNFRDTVAVTKPYKGNRDAAKPVHYNLVKQWYIDQGAYIVDGREADDELGLKQKCNTVICSIDKDLNQIPGLHFDWGKDIKYKVSEYDGQRYFLAQLLAGDSTDNIPGIPKIGMTTAFKNLDPLPELWDKWQAVVAIYTEKGYDKEYLTEQGKLLWMMRPELQDWTPDAYEDFLRGLNNGINKEPS